MRIKTVIICIYHHFNLSMDFLGKTINSKVEKKIQKLLKKYSPAQLIMDCFWQNNQF